MAELNALASTTHELRSLISQTVTHTSMVPTRIGKPEETGEHFPVREKLGNFAKTGKVREFYSKYWKNQKKLHWKIENKYRKICQPVIVKTL